MSHALMFPCSKNLQFVYFFVCHMDALWRWQPYGAECVVYLNVEHEISLWGISGTMTRYIDATKLLNVEKSKLEVKRNLLYILTHIWGQRCTKNINWGYMEVWYRKKSSSCNSSRTISDADDSSAFFFLQAIPFSMKLSAPKKIQKKLPDPKAILKILEKVNSEKGNSDSRCQAYNVNECL